MPLSGSSVTGSLSSVHEALGSILSATKRQRRKKDLKSKIQLHLFHGEQGGRRGEGGGDPRVNPGHLLHKTPART